MKKLILSVILPLTALFSTTNAAIAEMPQGNVVAKTKLGNFSSYD